VTLVAPADHRSGGNVERGEQASGRFCSSSDTLGRLALLRLDSPKSTALERP
jgi:hypothetical protein